MNSSSTIEDKLLGPKESTVPAQAGIQGKYQWVIRIISPLLFIANLAANQFQGMNKNKQTSNKFHLWVTPAGFFFAIWGVIYAGVAISVLYNLVRNVWNQKAHFWFGMSNIFSIFWTVVFDHDQLWTTVVASLIILCLALSVLFLWTALGDVDRKNVNFWTYFMRNTFALYLGWVIAATNINIGMDIVYWWGGSKQLQMIIFWIMAPICAVAGFTLNILRQGKFGFASCFCLWLSVGWAFAGAGMASWDCIHGKSQFC